MTHMRADGQLARVRALVTAAFARPCGCGRAPATATPPPRGRVRLRAPHQPDVIVGRLLLPGRWNQTVISPKLPYKLKVKATRWDDKPAANQRVRVMQNGHKMAADRSNKMATGTVFAKQRHVLRRPHYTTTARRKRAPLRAVALAAAARGPAPALGPLRAARVPLYVALPASDITTPLSVHFVVITRGGIIYRWGATTQCPTTSSTDYVPTTSRHNQCHNSYTANPHTSRRYYPNSTNFHINSLIYDTDKNFGVESTKFDTNRLKFDMCPDSHLIAYFYHKGELISASKHFEMDECFNNKVEISWTSRQVRPGGGATLQPTPVIALRRLAAARRNLTEFDTPYCQHSLEDPDSKLSGVEVLEVWMSHAGVRVGSAKKPDRASFKCDLPAPLIDDSPVPRSDFSEVCLIIFSGEKHPRLPKEEIEKRK
ncbi:hypothetical protein ACJJTC_005181 [Scirpophaga incertulas]